MKLLSYFVLGEATMSFPFLNDLNSVPGSLYAPSRTNNWFHFAIPTPVVINDSRSKLDSVLLQFNTRSTDAIIRDIHIYDGDQIVAKRDGINLSGDIGLRRFDVPDNPDVFLGVGISVGVEFGGDPVSHVMNFISAGCDFRSP